MAPIPEQKTSRIVENFHAQVHVKIVIFHAQELYKIAQKQGAIKNVSSPGMGEQCVNEYLSLRTT